MSAIFLSVLISVCYIFLIFMGVSISLDFVFIAKGSLNDERQCDRLKNPVRGTPGAIFLSNGCKRVFKYPLLAFGALIFVPMYDVIFDGFGTQIEEETVKLKDKVIAKK